MKQNIIFFGSGDYTIPFVGKLTKHGLSLVVTTEKNPESKFLKFCSDNNIKTLQVSNASDLINHKSLIINHDLGVLASFGSIILESVIKSFQNGIINIHPSLLPRWKGPSPIQYTLLNGDTQTGVTLIRLDNEIDHGNILAQSEYKLNGDETTQFLLDKLFSIGAEMVEKLIVKLENGEKLIETPQDHSKETWSYKIKKNDGYIDPDNLKAISYKLSAMIRAYYPWPGVWLIARIKNQELRIKLLPNNKIQVEGKNVMHYKDFINGYGNEGKTLLEKLDLN